LFKGARITLDRIASPQTLAVYPDGLYIEFSDSDEDSAENYVDEALEKKKATQTEDFGFGGTITATKSTRAERLEMADNESVCL
jgi:hypothetical protein